VHARRRDGKAGVEGWETGRDGMRWEDSPCRGWYQLPWTVNLAMTTSTAHYRLLQLCGTVIRALQCLDLVHPAHWRFSLARCLSAPPQDLPKDKKEKKSKKDKKRKHDEAAEAEETPAAAAPAEDAMIDAGQEEETPKEKKKKEKKAKKAKKEHPSSDAEAEEESSSSKPSGTSNALSALADELVVSKSSAVAEEEPVDLLALKKNKKTAVHPSRMSGAQKAELAAAAGADEKGFVPDENAIVIAEPVRIFVGNLPFKITDALIHEWSVGRGCERRARRSDLVGSLVKMFPSQQESRELTRSLVSPVFLSSFDEFGKIEGIHWVTDKATGQYHG
jgi:hypothetical protein